MKNEKEELNNVADKLASEIEEEGKLGFEDIDNEAQALLGVTPDKYEDEQMGTTIYCMLNMRGINTNFVTGDFYTDEYEKEHPEVAEDYNEKSEEEDIEESEEI